MNLSTLRDRMLVELIQLAPKETYSNLVGVLTRRKIPVRLRRHVFTAFANRVGADLSEVEAPLESYGCLDEFFTRKLKPGVRPFNADANVIVSPCDGTVAEFGDIDDERMIQAKGVHYRLTDLLCDAKSARPFVGGRFCTIYLSPRDYHRVHYSVDGTVERFHHIPGTLFPVNGLSTNNIPELYSRNERLVTYTSTPLGEVAYLMVAAVGVGHITVTYDSVSTRPRRATEPVPPTTLANSVSILRGDELGTFHLGSTVVMLFEPNRVEFLDLQVGQAIRLGQAIAKRIARNGVAPR